MLVQVRNRVEVDESYRVARAYGLFNVVPDMAQEFNLDVDVPVERDDWRIGVVYGPSGSGKTSIARALREEAGWEEFDAEWRYDAAIIDSISPDGDFEAVTGVLASVGLGTVPSWLRPYYILSNGEKFRADLAALLADGGTDIYIDEFTSVLDRQVAGFGAQAFAKAWRRGPQRRVVFLTPHFDVLGWLQPDWVIRTSLAGTAQYADSVDDVRPDVERDPDAPAVAEVRA